MKKFLFILFFCFSFFLAPNVLASEKINNYQVDIFIAEDSSLEVEETIEYDFGTETRHGIYRDIPLPKRDWRETPFDIFRIKTFDENGSYYKREISGNSKNLNIRIGSENEFVSGQKTYVINYRVSGAFQFEGEEAFLSWNAIGTAWDVPIEKTNVNVYFPEGLPQSQFDTNCFWGKTYSREKCPGEFFVSENQEAQTISSLVFKTESLKPRQGVTVDVRFQPGVVEVVGPPNIILAWFKHFGFILWPIFTLIIMFYVWFVHGRDPRGRGVIIAQYDVPKDMMPAELGSIYDESVHNKDISAEIIYLAIRGYLKIHRIKKSHIFAKDDYVLEQLKKGDDLPRQYQKDLIENLFSKPSSLGEYSGLDISANSLAVVKMSDLNKKAYKWMKEIRQEIYKQIHSRGFFYHNPNKIRSYYSIGIVLIIILIQVFAMAGEALSDLIIYNVMAIIASVFIVFIFGFAMPKKTPKGVLAKEYILGLKLYINVAEKDRIKFHNAPEKDPQIFEKLLPYAMAFGLEKKWAKQFEDIYLEEPNWYAGGAAHFSATNFGSSLNGFRSSAAQAARSASSGGSGGGFSGGGVGGGGGGSW